MSKTFREYYDDDSFKNKKKDKKKKKQFVKNYLKHIPAEEMDIDDIDEIENT